MNKDEKGDMNIQKDMDIQKNEDNQKDVVVQLRNEELDDISGGIKGRGLISI